jgi:hypothetical protein
MEGKERNIRFLYKLALAEGEGVGTAYEYHAKLRKLQRFLSAVERPKQILVAGLPERYGFSMDFVLLSELMCAEVLVADERPERVERAKEVLGDLSSRGILRGSKVRFCLTEPLAEMQLEDAPEGGFDLALSCEVLQRIGDHKHRYVSRLKELARSLGVFAPNRGNESHAKLSGLESVFLEELLALCEQGAGRVRILDDGFVDLPPFPPGVQRSQEKREQATESSLEGLLMRGLELYCSLEGVCPKFLKERFAHIVYVLAVSNGAGMEMPRRRA